MKNYKFKKVKIRCWIKKKDCQRLLKNRFSFFISQLMKFKMNILVKFWNIFLIIVLLKNVKK